MFIKFQRDDIAWQPKETQTVKNNYNFKIELLPSGIHGRKDNRNNQCIPMRVSRILSRTGWMSSDVNFLFPTSERNAENQPPPLFWSLTSLMLEKLLSRTTKHVKNKKMTDTFARDTYLSQFSVFVLYIPWTEIFFVTRWLSFDCYLIHLNSSASKLTA